MELEPALFEPFLNAVPFRVLSRHPGGLLVALQAVTSHPQTGGIAEFSALWDVQTHKLIWESEGVIALTWNSDGSELGLIREQYAYDPTAHAIIGSALQREFSYTWERLSWPEKGLLHSCPITMPMGWPATLAISPRGNLAVFQWFDQCESGLEFLTLTPEGDFQLPETGLPLSSSVRPNCLRTGGNGYPIGSNLATLPVFSLDGRFLVFGWQDDWEWWADLSPGASLDDDPASRGGECQMGVFEIIDWETRTVRQIPVVVNLSAGWRPTGTGGPPQELMADPIFIDGEHFQWLSPTGERRLYSVWE